MSMCYIKKSLFIIFILLGFSIKAQDDFSLFSETSLSINHAVSQSYKMNFSFKGRAYLYEDSELFVKQRQFELGHFSTLNLNSRSSLSLGVMYRNRDWFEDSSNEFRLTQQYNKKGAIQYLRIGHRLRVEQRFFETLTVHRLRYRFALDIPLSGEKLDVGEAYLITSSELLWSLSKNTPLLGNRVTLFIGWNSSEKLKIQLGIENRFSEFNQKLDYSLFILPELVVKI